MSKLQEWVNERSPWVGDAIHRAAFSSEGIHNDAKEAALRVQAANGISAAGQPDCEVFDAELLKIAVAGEEAPVLCSIGPLENIDRLEAGQVLKFAQNGLTVIYGDNGSGKSGYARAARRLCTHRVSRPLQKNVFEKAYDAEIKVNLATKTGEAAIAEHQWTEGTSPPLACQQMTFLDTANAQVYVDGGSEILFLPPEVQCLTTLGSIFGLASEVCQKEADRLGGIHLGKVVGYNAGSKVSNLTEKLTTSISLEDLPTVEAIRKLGVWEDVDEAKLSKTQADLSATPEAQTLMAKSFSKSIGGIVENGKLATSLLNEPQLANDLELLKAKKTAFGAADAAVKVMREENPIPDTGSDAWKELFLHARRYAHAADVVPFDAAFDVGDPCVVCQRPLDEESRDRLNRFDVFIEDETTKAVDAAKVAIATRVSQLEQLALLTGDEVAEEAKEFLERHEECSKLVTDVANTFAQLERCRKAVVDHLVNSGEAPNLPDVASLDLLGVQKEALVAKVAELAKATTNDPEQVALEIDLLDRKRLVEELEQIVARRDGLEDRLRYLQCVKDLNKGPVSAMATKLRNELVTPALEARINQEISDIGLEHIPMSFATKTKDGKSFFDVALDSVDVKKAEKSEVLSEGEQRALAIACFLADPHVSQNKSAIIVDDPVTSLDHNRIRRVASRFAKEAGRRNQVIIFTHNLLFYQELLRACAECDPQIPVTKCMIRKSTSSFGLVTVNDEPWVAKKVKDRMAALTAQLDQMPKDIVPGSEQMRTVSKQFYTDLRETWERTVEEVVLGGVVERFGSDVKTQSLKNVDISDDDYRKVFSQMKRASELSGHDRAAGRQLDPPDKQTMRDDLESLRAFCKAYKAKSDAADKRRRAQEGPPVAVTS